MTARRRLIAAAARVLNDRYARQRMARQRELGLPWGQSKTMRV